MEIKTETSASVFFIAEAIAIQRKELAKEL